MLKKLSVLMLLVLMTAAFGLQIRAQDATTEAEPPTATPAPTETFVPSAEGTLTIWSDRERQQAMESLGKEFTAKYNVPVRVQTMGFGDVRNNLALGGPVGQGPDIIIGAHDWLGQLQSNGLLAPIEMSDELKANFAPAALDAFSTGGKLYGLPYSVEGVALYYNTDLVPEPPKTWDDAVKLAEQLVKDGKVERGIGIPNGGGDPYHHYFFFTSEGAYVFGKDANGTYDPKDLGLDSAGGLKAVEAIDKAVKAGVLSASVDGDVQKDLFLNGKLAMWVSGPWQLGDLEKSDIKYAIAPIPTVEGESRPFVGVQGFMINSFSKNVALAQAFLTEYVASDEGMKLLYEAKPFIPAWKPLADSLDNKDLASFQTAIANGDPMPSISEMNAVWTAWGNAITLIYQQKEDPDKAIKDAAASIRDTIAKGGS
jgi:maltose-binding protein MalE